MVLSPTLYAHRRNEAGSYDSICRMCFAAVARSKPEAELESYEKAHTCESSFLADRGHLHQAESLRYSAAGSRTER